MPSDTGVIEIRSPSRGVKILAAFNMIVGAGALLLGLWCLWLVFYYYRSSGYNESAGFALMFAVAGLLLGSLLLITGRRTLALRPSGWIFNFAFCFLSLPLSILLIIYLLNKNVQAQFNLIRNPK